MKTTTRRWTIALLAGCWMTGAASQAVPAQDPPQPTKPELQAELLELRRQDQDALHDKTMQEDRLRALQQAHTRRLKAIVAEYGWPTLSMVGNDAAQGAWLLVQHADDDHAWQRSALGLMEQLVPANEVRKADIAYLRDRLDRASELPQRYGTQGHCVARGQWEPFTILDPAQVDARRLAMDLSTLEAYVARASNALCRNYTPPNPG